MPKAPGGFIPDKKCLRCLLTVEMVWFCAVWVGFLVAIAQLSLSLPETGQAIPIPAGIPFGRTGSAAAEGRCSTQCCYIHPTANLHTGILPLLHSQLNIIALSFKILSKSVSLPKWTKG